MMLRRKGAPGIVVLCVLAALTASAYACNIPVFRYALERWRPDPCELIVFHDGTGDSAEQALIQRLESRGGTGTERANLEIRSCNVNEHLDPDLSVLWNKLKTGHSAHAPYAALRIPHPRGLINGWHGPLDQAWDAALIDSPVRTELAKRLLAGDSIVWLILRSEDKSRNLAVKKLISEQCQVLGNKMQLPDGIGLPGSELFSEVPLYLKFSVLEIEHNDPRERFLTELFVGFQPEAAAAGEPLVIPVFGRGRAFEVIPSRIVNERLVEDVTGFLSGACSCQVKEQNPGFDLLLVANWERELFGEGHRPPPAKSVGEGDRAPVLLTIPPGR